MDLWYHVHSLKDSGGQRVTDTGAQNFSTCENFCDYNTVILEILVSQ